MLVLSRMTNERIVISGRGITINLVVVETRHDKVRLGIDAPLDIAVHRAEVAEAIARMQQDRPTKGNTNGQE